MSDKTGRESDKIMLRVPDGMRDRLKDEAAANNRSMNSEIVARLEASFSESDISAREARLERALDNLLMQRDDEAKQNAALKMSIATLSAQVQSLTEAAKALGFSSPKPTKIGS